MEQLSQHQLTPISTLVRNSSSFHFFNFILGSLNHFNFPISSGTAADYTFLNLVVTFRTTANVFVATQTFSFQMTVDETPNSTPPPCAYRSSTPCADKISYPVGGFDTTKSFTYNEVSYTLQLKGNYKIFIWYLFTYSKIILQFLFNTSSFRTSSFTSFEIPSNSHHQDSKNLNNLLLWLSTLSFPTKEVLVLLTSLLVSQLPAQLPVLVVVP